MSETNEKKARKAAAAAEQAKKDKKFKRNAIIICVILALLIVSALVINSNIFYTGTTAVEIGNVKYTPAEYNFYYNSIFNSMYNELYGQYGEIMPYILDTEVPLDEQICMFGDGEMTWADYFKDQTITEMTAYTVLYEAAIKDGYTLSEEDKATVDAAMIQYENNAAMYGYGSVDSFMAATFGKGVDAELFREIAEMQTLATRYSTDLGESFSYSDDELEAHYAENKDDYDHVTYHSYFVSSSGTAFEALSDEEKLSAASEAAQLIAEATTPEEFAAKIVEFVGEDMKDSYADPDATKSLSQGAGISDEYKAWLMDESRVEGDTTVIDAEGGSYVLMFVSRSDNHYNTVNARHILIGAEASEDGSYSDEALTIAKERAEELMAEWELNPTEEYFAELANTFSEDDGSNTVGGLYEDIFKDYMVEEFDAFLFDEHRLPGDTGIVYGTNGYYAGYHLIYYVGQGDLYSNIVADSAMREADYNAAVTALSEGYEASEGFGMNFTTK